MADNSGEETEIELEDGSDELDPLAGEELFDVPDDLKDLPDEAPAPGEAPDPAKAAPPAKPAQATQPRDEESGKFIPKDQAPAATDQPSAPAQGDQSGAPPAQAAATEAEPEPELEFSFRGDGRQIQIPGSRVTKDSIIIPRDQAPQFQRLLSHGLTYQGSFRQRLEESARREQATRTEVHEEVEKARALLNFWADMTKRLDAGEIDDEGRTPLESWIDGFRQNRVKLEAEMDLAAAKAFRERKDPGPVRVEGFDDDPAAAAQAEPEEDLEALSQELSPQLGQRLTAMMQPLGIRGLSGAELTRIRDWMIAPERIGQFFMRAAEDIPAAEWGGNADIKKGQLVAMDSAIRETLKHQAGLILDARKAALELRNAEAANGKRPANQIPPVTTVSGDGVPKKKGQMPHFPNTPEGKEAMERWFNSNEGDPG